MKNRISGVPIDYDFTDLIYALSIGGRRLSNLVDHDIYADFDKLKRDIGHDEDKFIYKVNTFLKRSPWYSSLINPDRFFSIIQYGMANSFEWVDKAVSFPKEAKDLRDCILDRSYHTVRKCTRREQVYQDSCHRVGQLNDGQLISEAGKKVKITARNLWEPSEGIVFSKLNHGFWEFFFSAYSDFRDHDYIARNIRDRRQTNRPRESRISGFYEALSVLADSMPMWQRNGANGFRFGIGIGAGQVRFDKMLSDGQLTPVSRGALMGLLSFFEGMENGFDFVFEDGAEPREMLFEGMLPEFMENNVHTSNACLVISPKHLEGIVLPLYSGRLFHMAIPRAVVHQSWRSVLAIVIGKIDVLMRQYGKVTVLMQGANFSALVAFVIQHVFTESERRAIKFFDLGRLLDVARPDICERYPSFTPLFENRIRMREIREYIDHEEEGGSL